MERLASRLMLVLLPSWLALSAPVSAALVEEDWRLPGDALLTLDTNTGLQWLDVTVTQGATWSAVTSELAAGGALAAFRHATQAEITQFWVDAGIPARCCGLIAAGYASVKALQDLWGTTGVLPPLPGISTFVTMAESFVPARNEIQGTSFLNRVDSEGTAGADIGALWGQPDQPFPFLAHALVLQEGATVPAVPEATTGILFLVGLGCCGLPSARRRMTPAAKLT